MTLPLVPLVVIGGILAAAGYFYLTVERKQQAGTEAIRSYAWPPGLVERLAKRHPDLSSADLDLVSQGLRQFFRAYLASGGRSIAMPSRVVDDLWHEFILYTRDYELFCQQAFGRFLHHAPTDARSEQREAHERGLYRVWRHCCQEEGVDAEQASRLPLLFALDSQLGIADGFAYRLDWAKHLRQGAGCSGGGDSDGCGGSGD